MTISLFFLNANAQQSSVIIPKPVSESSDEGVFHLSASTIIVAPDSVSFSDATVFFRQLKSIYNVAIKIRRESKAKKNIIRLNRMEHREHPDEYLLLVDRSSVLIEGRGSGIFYGLQSLLQLVAAKNNSLYIPCGGINDYPRFAWRGMHLDCGRHFFSVGEVKKYVDYLALHKMNIFHWHLTEDQGWRIEIKKYPKLTEVGAWRYGTLIGHYGEEIPKYDTSRYGGFYSQEQVKDIVAYATQRHVTIVPEIEMPGHSLAALAAYPELACTGGPFEVSKTWGVFDDVYCPKEETFQFLEDILTEVCDLFPGKYIHIGGDECPKVRWKANEQCQKIIADHNLKDENGLQSYFIARIEKFLNKKGKKIIGWDEILDGGLSPDAAVMSWRGVNGGTEAAKQKHFVVMTPTDYCYFDYYQSRYADEPLSIGGYLPLEKVYNYEPIPDSLYEDEQKYILGTQGNVWTEYLPTFDRVEYNALPRMCALAEVAWTPKEKRNYDDFEVRLINHFRLLDKLKVNYCKAIYDIAASTGKSASGNGLVVSLTSRKKDTEIRYSINEQNLSSSSLKYNQPLMITKNTLLKAALFKDGKQQGRAFSQAYTVNKATGAKITLEKNPDRKYSTGGAFTLVNGITGTLPWNGSDWLGFSGDDLQATVDMGHIDTVSKVTVDVLEDKGSWIYLPRTIAVSFSIDGNLFSESVMLSQDEIQKMKRKLEIDVVPTAARYIKITATNKGIIPTGSQGEGHPAWLFVDEIGAE